MAVRIRESGKVLCAAMHGEGEEDLYLDDGIHYYLSVVAKVLVTEPHDLHKLRGEWWWINNIPEGVYIDPFYKEKL